MSYFTSSSVSSSTSVAQWQIQIMNWWSDLGVPAGVDQSQLCCRPWTMLTDHKYAGINMSPRTMAILDCVTMQTLGGFQKTQQMLQHRDRVHRIQNVMASIVCDLSQNPVRRAFSQSSGLAKCQTTSSILYSYGKDRLITAYEQLLLQGHSRSMKLTPDMKQSDVSDLAGMGISLPCLGLCVVAMLCSVGLGSEQG